VDSAKLRIADYVDVVTTTDKFGVREADRMFGVAVEHLEIDSQTMGFVGDSVERDIALREQAGFSLFSTIEWRVVLDGVTDLKHNSPQTLENSLSF
jgi:FMN phosphatase YigB (HAD superfamily)